MAFTIKKLGRIAYDKALDMQQQTFLEVSTEIKTASFFANILTYSPLEKVPIKITF